MDFAVPIVGVPSTLHRNRGHSRLRVRASASAVATIDANHRRSWRKWAACRPFNGWFRAAARVKAKVLVIIDVQDHMVTPQAALDFTSLLHAKVMALESDCGHNGPECDMKSVAPQVAAFLNQ